MKIGELAKKTGISVRSLHHYDEIGLLKPTTRSESEHRIYTKEDVRKLQKIVTLKGVGLPLIKIASVLEEQASSVQSTVDRHIEILECEIEEKTSTIARLKTAQKLIKDENNLSVNELVDAIAQVSMLDQDLSHEEILEIGQRMNNFVDQEGFESQVRSLISEIRSATSSGVTPDSESAQTLLSRWVQLRDFMTNANPDLNIRARAAVEKNPSLKEQLGVDNETMNFLQKCADVRKGRSTQ